MAKESYAIDALIETIKKISISGPVFFQRDEEFYAATPYCFGKIGFGLSTTENTRGWNGFDKEFPEIGASENIIIGENKSRENEKTEFKKGERDYILPLVFNIDSMGDANLNTISDITSKLKELPDDGKIRMISHDFRYRSHKHGYACDGTDIWLSEARVMDRENYFELMREKEEKFFEALKTKNEHFLNGAYMISTSYPQGGKPVKIPDSMIVTPNIMLTFPRLGIIDYHNRDQSWDNKKDLGKERPIYSAISTYEKSPFLAHLTLNRKIMQAYNLSELEELTSETMEKISKDLVGIKKSMPQIQSFLLRINNIHNQCFKENITHTQNLIKV